MAETQADRPWLIRTYAGHSTAKASNALFRSNLAKGQTGLSVAFDLPTQTGHDSDDPAARGEVGKVGVPVCHLGDMRLLFDGIPLERMNTSMTINATAPWILALYLVVAEEQGADVSKLSGTVQNDMVKEYLSRGTYICPPEPSLRMMGDVAEHCLSAVPKWNPVNVCSYHLQEAGATTEQELAYALATAAAMLEEMRRRVPEADFPALAGRVSFFVNAGIRFVTEMCKMRAFAELWDEMLRERFGVADPKLRRFRYGVQVNSLGLTAQQPENNVCRIMLEMLAVTLSRRARARAVQLPAWNEALGLPRPWDQQWSMRMQQILAHETDLLEYGDLFDGNPQVEARVEALREEARRELGEIEAMGGAISAIGHMKARLVDLERPPHRPHRERRDRRGRGQQMDRGRRESADGRWRRNPGGRSGRRGGSSARASPRGGRSATAPPSQPRSSGLREAAKSGANVMPASIEAARAGATTGEWAAQMRQVHGEFRAPTGVSPSPSNQTEDLDDLRAAVDAASDRLGRRLKLLLGKPGLDGHSNGVEQIASRARDCGMDIAYDGIRAVAGADRRGRARGAAPCGRKSRFCRVRTCPWSGS